MNIADMKRLEEEYKKLSKNSGMGGGSVVMYGGSSGTKVKGYDQVYVKVDDVNHVGAVEQMIKDIGYQTSSMTQYREDMQKQVASGQMMLGGPCGGFTSGGGAQHCQYHDDGDLRTNKRDRRDEGARLQAFEDTPDVPH